MSNRHYTLSQLCEQIQDALSDGLESSYWVQAEISSLSERGGHLYLELIEQAAQGKGKNALMAAKVRATCWQGTQELLRAYFEAETGSPLQVGMQVLVEAEVQFHAVYGLSLTIKNIDPSYTLGDLARKRQQTIAQLEADGVIGMQQMLSLPTLVQRIAVVSSPGAAGYEDFMHQLQQSGFRFQTQLYEAVMQGNGAEKSIIAALENIAADEAQWDAVAIIRGGGATTDMSCFDQYTLCALCAQMPLPILSGIGHTRDVSVLDMVAYQALKTPTAVAAWLIDRMEAQLARIDDLATRLKRTAERQVMIRLHRVEMLEQRIVACNPERIYKMGYSLTTCGGRIVRSVKDVQHGERLSTHLLDGTIESTAE